MDKKPQMVKNYMGKWNSMIDDKPIKSINSSMFIKENDYAAAASANLHKRSKAQISLN